MQKHVGQGVYIESHEDGTYSVSSTKNPYFYFAGLSTEEAARRKAKSAIRLHQSIVNK